MDSQTYVDFGTALSPITTMPVVITSPPLRRVAANTGSHANVLHTGVAKQTNPRHVQTTSAERQFKKFASKWKADTRFTSSVEDMAMNPFYQQIIGMGPTVVPFILKSLKKEPDFWFWALRSITRENPVPKSDLGDLQKMSEAWLRWGAARGYNV
jgi:hypothetical protein